MIMTNNDENIIKHYPLLFVKLEEIKKIIAKKGQKNDSKTTKNEKV